VIRRSPLVLAVIVVVLLCSSAARAGTYDVVACDAAPGFVNRAWVPQVTHGGTVAFTACPSSDVAMKGLGARTNYPYPSGWTVPTGAAARWIFHAPPGTAIVGIRANVFYISGRATDGRSALERLAAPRRLSRYGRQSRGERVSAR
jgi:hypothetical protein